MYLPKPGGTALEISATDPQKLSYLIGPEGKDPGPFEIKPVKLSK
jgi:hypothetical protein